MIAELAPECTLRDKAAVVRALERSGYRVRILDVGGTCLVHGLGHGADGVAELLARMPGVCAVRAEAPPYPLAAARPDGRRRRVSIDGVVVGGAAPVVIAGPCSVESREQLGTTAAAVARAGARLLRGGAFKPRTSPYSFQGLGEAGLELLSEARAATGLPIVTEVLAAEDVPLLARHADLLQVGARSMQNFRLLAALGDQPKPVLLKRGHMSTIAELLQAAEYVLAGGNPGVVLCERGIRTFETSTRATLDVSAVAVLHERTHLPVIVDPSHAAGRRALVPALACAAIAAGADGLLIEVHPHPDQALSDGRQSLGLDAFASLMRRLERIAEAVDRPFETRLDPVAG